MFILKTTNTTLVGWVNHRWYENTKWKAGDYYYGEFTTIFKVTCFLPHTWITNYNGYHYKIYKTKAAARAAATRIMNAYVQTLEDLANFTITIEEV